MLDQELLARAEANDVQAIFEVAKAYYMGKEVEEDNDKGKRTTMRTLTK